MHFSRNEQTYQVAIYCIGVVWKGIQCTVFLAGIAYINWSLFRDTVLADWPYFLVTRSNSLKIKQ